MPRSILLVSHEYAPYVGGVATYAQELARAASEQGDRVEVFCPSYGAAPSQRPETPTRTVTRFPGGTFRGSRDLPGFAVRLRAKIAEGYDIVHGVDIAAHMALQLLARTVGLSRPFFLSAHGTEILLYQKVGRYRWLMRDVFRRAAHTIAGSHFAASLIHRFDPRLDAARVSVVHYGLAERWLATALPDVGSIRQRLGIPADDFVVLTVARLVRRKGHRFVVRGLSTLPPARRDHVTYVVVGAGDEAYAREVVGDARASGVRLMMAGQVADQDLPAYYQAADLFALLADPAADEVEGFGLVVIEAASQGLPSIGASVGGIPEAVAHENTGLVVDPQDAEAVGRAIERLASDRELLRRFAAAAQRRAATFSWEQTARLTYTAFEHALAEHDHSRPAKARR